MRCPSCGTHHPPQYEQCVSCGQDFYPPDNKPAEAAPSNLSQGVEDDGAVSSSASGGGRRRGQEHFAVTRSSQELAFDHDAPRPETQGDRRRAEDFGDDESAERPHHQRRSKSIKFDIRSGMPGTSAAIFVAVVLLVLAGASIFFLTKAPEEDRLLKKGLDEIKNGQYAFAVETLTKASDIAKNNPKIQLTLARAYVGVDQVDKAWDCISRAKQMGRGIAEDPDLASQLAKYYSMHHRFDKAVELLRPLAAINVPGKKAELADLDAQWGDEELRDGKLTTSLALWEEVKNLNDGARKSEADNRLATIYQRLAGKLIDDKKDEEALNYLNKLNAIAENPRNYETCAQIYERTGKLELAIDQLRKAQRLAAHDDALTHKLAALLTKRGKELLDAGELDTGYGYLQQARSVDPNSSVATVTLKGVNIDVQGGMPHISGQVWNPTDIPINALVMKTELVDVQDEHVIWTKESKVVDEYVPPLGSREGKRIDVTSGMPAKLDGSTEWKIYFDGKLYNSYLVGKKDRTPKEKVEATTTSDTKPARTEQPAEPTSAPQPVAPTQGTSSEEKTMKDLGF